MQVLGYIDVVFLQHSSVARRQQSSMSSLYLRNTLGATNIVDVAAEKSSVGARRSRQQRTENEMVVPEKKAKGVGQPSQIQLVSRRSRNCPCMTARRCQKTKTQTAVVHPIERRLPRPARRNVKRERDPRSDPN